MLIKLINWSLERYKATEKLREHEGGKLSDPVTTTSTEQLRSNVWSLSSYFSLAVLSYKREKKKANNGNPGSVLPFPSAAPDSENSLLPTNPNKKKRNGIMWITEFPNKQFFFFSPAQNCWCSGFGFSRLVDDDHSTSDFFFFSS